MNKQHHDSTKKLLEKIEIKEIESRGKADDMDKAKQKKTEILEDLKDVIKRHQDGVHEDSRKLLDNIKKIKMYSTGNLEIVFKREEKIKFYLMNHTHEPKTFDVENNSVRF